MITIFLGEITKQKEQDDIARKKPTPSETLEKDAKSRGYFSCLFHRDEAESPCKTMILPDDTTPSIVWDNELKRYVNTEEGEDDTALSTPEAPPMIMPSKSTSFRRPLHRKGSRKRYVEVS